MSLMLLQNCTLVDGTAADAREGYDVLIENEIIREVSDHRIKSDNAITFDLKGRTLMPGLIDAHVHVAAPELSLETDKIPWSYASIQAGIFLENTLQRGFTSVRDAGGADFGIALAIEKGLINGPRLFYSGKALSQTGGHGDFRDRNTPLACCGYQTPSGSVISQIVDGITEVRRAAREELRKGASQIKIMAAGGVTSPNDKLTDLQFSREEIIAIVEETQARGAYVMAHVFTPEGIQRCIDCGVRTIEHGTLLDATVAKAMAASDVFLVPTLTIAQVILSKGKEFGLNEATLKKMASVAAKAYEAITNAKANKVKIGFGSDVFGDVTHALQTNEFLYRSEVLSNFELIKSATLVNAEILQQQDKLGIIKTGALADLIVVDGDPLKDIHVLVGQGEKLDLIMKNGVVYKNRL